MATTTDKTPEAPTLEQELESLELEENNLEDRTSALELKTTLVAMIAGVALVFGIAALAVALIRTGGSGGNTTTVTMPSNGGAGGMMSGAAQSSGGSGAGMMSGTSQSVPVVNGAHVITVQLGEMFVRPSVTSVPAGKVTFKATNSGSLVHELMVERMPIKFDAVDKPTESAAQGMIEDMDAGKSGQMTLKLTPGKYMLFCNVPGHYAAGQHTVLTVTQS